MKRSECDKLPAFRRQEALFLPAWGGIQWRTGSATAVTGLSTFTTGFHFATYLHQMSQNLRAIESRPCLPLCGRAVGKNYSKLSKRGAARPVECRGLRPHPTQPFEGSLKALRTPSASAARSRLRLGTAAAAADVPVRKNHCTERTAHLSRLRRDFYTAACCFTLAVSVCLPLFLPLSL